MGATVVTPGFGHRPRVSAQVRNMRHSAIGKNSRTPSSANPLRNDFESFSFADHGDSFSPWGWTMRGYPLDDDGNYPENARWYRWRTGRSRSSTARTYA